MTSIHTNAGAIAALQTLRSIDSDMTATQGRVSSGLRVQTAADNAAYWSIGTTMRSDNRAMSAVADALGFAAAKVDTAYTGLNAVVDILGDFKAKLVAAKEPGVDKQKIQKELSEYKQQVWSVAQSASFNGQNWLVTDIANIYDYDLNAATSAASFTRNASGGVSVKTMNVHLSDVSLFNSTGGGLLQADARDLETLGGMRNLTTSINPPTTIDSTPYDGNQGSGWMYPSGSIGVAGSFRLNDFPVGSSLDFNTPGAQISFDIILDKEDTNPHGYTGTQADLNELPGPYYPGYSKTITIDKAVIDAYDAALGGVITTNTQFAGVLNSVLNAEGAYVSANSIVQDPPGSGPWVHDKKTMIISTNQIHGDGSYVEIANLTSVAVGTGGLTNGFDYGTRGSGMELNFQQFIVHQDGDNEDGVDIHFSFSLNGAPPKSYSFDRTYVNTLFGKDSGKVETSAEMATLLNSLLAPDWPGLIIAANSATTVMMKSDPALDRTWGSGTRIAFDQIRVSIEPIPTINFLEIDIAQNPAKLDSYIDYIDIVSERIIDGATALGAFQSRIDMQSDFAAELMSIIDKGIGRLVDADMNEESTRLKALQTQEQLGIQALQIANSNSENIMALFR
ncbi:hypothetical protein ASG50_10160 [Rhizobium sp. Leaf386]|nr:flagellin [Rhizobium sp. Leaf386]KQS87989.1 hypothetical protein ASG50_10160 [Rhizobium sp. Leaf386]